MTGSPGKRRLPTNNLVVITATAVLLLTAVLFWLQYRSLQQLRIKTRIVAQEQVRQGLEILQQRLEEHIATIASDSLARTREYVALAPKILCSNDGEHRVVIRRRAGPLMHNCNTSKIYSGAPARSFVPLVARTNGKCCKNSVK